MLDGWRSLLVLMRVLLGGMVLAIQGCIAASDRMGGPVSIVTFIVLDLVFVVIAFGGPANRRHSDSRRRMGRRLGAASVRKA